MSNVLYLKEVEIESNWNLVEQELVRYGMIFENKLFYTDQAGFNAWVSQGLEKLASVDFSDCRTRIEYYNCIFDVLRDQKPTLF